MKLEISNRGRLRAIADDIGSGGWVRPELFIPPRQHYEIWAAAVGATLATATTAYSLSGAGQPQEPDLASSSAELSNAEAAELPIERQMQAAAADGGTVLNPGYTQSTSSDQQRAQLQNQISKLQAQLKGTPSGQHMGQINPVLPQQAASINSQISQLQSQLANIPAGNGQPIYLNSQGQVVPQSQAMTNFNGYGTQQVQDTIAQQMAPGELALAQQYDPQFIAQSLQEENLANPQGAQARTAENNLIQQLINQPYDQPVANTLTNQVDQQVQAGQGLDTFDQNTLNNSVQSALASRGGSGTPADFSAPLTTGQTGEQRQLAAVQKGLSLLSSGTTPQDVEYRRQQQNLSNLASEYSGQTPVTEFASLSGAQSGPAPLTAGTPLPTLGDTLGTAAGAAATQYGQQVSQANPWLSGISSVLSAGNTVANGINTGVKAGAFGPTAN
jgi:hypothetical protein